MTADSALKQLLVVQDHDRRLDGLRHERESLPEFEELTRLDEATKAVDTEAADVTDARHELARTQKRLEDEVALIEDRITEEDAKLYGGEVTGVKDLQALQDEIAGLKTRQELVEDQILEVMEQAEPLDAELGVFDQRKMAIADDRAKVEQAIVEAHERIDADLEAETAARAAAAGEIDPALLAEYDSIRSQPGRIGVAGGVDVSRVSPRSSCGRGRPAQEAPARRARALRGMRLHPGPLIPCCSGSPASRS